MKRTIADIIKENSHTSLSLFSQKGFTVKEVQICTCCEGMGRVVITEDKGHSEGLVEEVKECDNCKGSGRIEATVTIVRKPFKSKEND